MTNDDAALMVLLILLAAFALLAVAFVLFRG